MVNWRYDELVLVGDAVSRNGGRGIRASSPEAQVLSDLLRRGQLHPGQELPEDFRSPSSIQRKSYDIQTAHPEYRGTPTRGGRLDPIVAEAFQSDLDGMRAKAAAIRDALRAGEVLPADDLADSDDEADEGGILEYLARRRERDRGLRARKIAAVRASGGAIACEVCGFNFEAVYGQRGAGYIEVHHKRPLHASGPVTTRLGDLALLCANCHRMCHRGGWITPDALAALLGSRE
jgi:5-methylcytosine-specific restriction protein A